MNIAVAPAHVAAQHPLLQSLNEPQRAAVTTTQGPLLVLAGAGTGKTRVLTTRIAYLLTQGLAYPSQILAVTFTNKAAREMAERVNHLVGNASNNAENQTPENARSSLYWLGTFHSVAAKMLRKHAAYLGLSPQFTILGEDDQIRLIKAISAEMQLDDKQHPPKALLGMIQQWKDQGLRPDQIGNSRGGANAAPIAHEVYVAYQARLLKLDACDFGDLMLHMLTIFSRVPEVLAEYANKFRYVLVDEYQDTNVAQYLWLRLLAAGHGNVCCVGDDDQSIYSWRGADVGNILKFERDFNAATVIRLEENYRSTPHILAAASAVIAHNRSRLGKTLWTQVNAGEKVAVKPTWDDREEAQFIGGEIEVLQRDRHRLNDIAILVRAGFQTRIIEERFLSMGIPYRVIGGLRFYERAEIRDAIAYLRLVQNPNDDLAFERIINLPRRGVGQATMQQLHSQARSAGGSLFAATEALLRSGALKGKLGSTLTTFLAHFARWSQQREALTLAELTDRVLEESGYREHWQQDKSPEAQGRLDNLRELVRAMGEFESLAEFLEHVSLVSALDEQNTTDMVSLMTLHASKGLEFRAVFLPGWEEGIFPHQRALDESGEKGLEEERRLAYVGITRAREKLMISHAANRRMYNQWQTSIPSRFLTELPPEHLELLPGSIAMMPAQSSATGMKMNHVLANVQAALAQHAPSAAQSEYARGTRVFHQKFGYGKVISAQGHHLEIAFEKAGVKKILADFIEKA